jgi:ATP-binding cassette subfamily B protein
LNEGGEAAVDGRRELVPTRVADDWSLDAPSEHALFERHAAAACEVRSSGAITVLVSHRFSTVRMADLIILVDAGRAIEVGSHEDLLAKGGHYAELFELQAAGYR